MRLPALLAACILVIPTYTTAQTTAADGVVALFRGDAASAVRILGPLVEGRADPGSPGDVLSRTCLPVRRRGSLDSTRSCGLFLKAATPSSPLLRQAELLAKESHLNHEIARNQCAIAATRGWGQPAWTTFTLSRAHRVRIDQNGFTCRVRGRVEADTRRVGRRRLAVPADPPDGSRRCGVGRSAAVLHRVVRVDSAHAAPMRRSGAWPGLCTKSWAPT